MICRCTSRFWLVAVMAALSLSNVSCISFPAARPEGLSGRHCAAIEAADKVSFSDERMSVLCEIAQQPDLTETEQIFLVNVTLRCGFSDDQANVLVILASNPCLTGNARMHLAKRLGRIGFSDDRKRVATALARNPGHAEVGD